MEKRILRKTGKRTRRHPYKNEKLLILAIVLMIFCSTVATYAQQLVPQNQNLEAMPPEKTISAENIDRNNIDDEPVENTPKVEDMPKPADAVNTAAPSPTEHTNDVYNADGTTITVYYHKSGKSGEADLEEYLLHVMGAEIPYSFGEEALKAQAVAARSYIVYRVQNNNSKAHANGEDICTSPSHCLAYAFDEDFPPRFAENSERAIAAYKKAIDATRGEILVYEDKVALGVFHAMSGGHTESANAVWGGNYPYLVSASSSGEENFKNFETTVSFSRQEFEEKAKTLGVTEEQISQNPPVEILTKSSGGGVTSLLIYGVQISGAQARATFGLRTNLFEVLPEGVSVAFRVLGWGHRVGMSQYGAEAMAKSGASYLEILGNYYKNCEIRFLKA